MRPWRTSGTAAPRWKMEVRRFLFTFKQKKLEIFGRKECINNIRKERKMIEKSCNTVHRASMRWKVTPLHLWWHPPYNSNDKPTSAVVLTYLFKTRWCAGTLCKSTHFFAMDAAVERLPWWLSKYFWLRYFADVQKRMTRLHGRTIIIIGYSRSLDQSINNRNEQLLRIRIIRSRLRCTDCFLTRHSKLINSIRGSIPNGKIEPGFLTRAVAHSSAPQPTSELPSKNGVRSPNRGQKTESMYSKTGIHPPQWVKKGIK